MKNKLIDADSYIKNFCNRFCSVKECTSTQKKSCCIAISLKDEPAVENVTDTNVGEWIPCSERLPENNGNYMTCDEKGNIHIFWYDDCQKCPFNISEYHTRYYPVVAWMPLPEPYKGE